ncbi:hypothetical protein OIO90_002918 [Microbotryomycetes sp. JL221]|nr:hypothetical protein OIO90_002918 [Microbotryomycetes sp. JL221]
MHVNSFLPFVVLAAAGLSQATAAPPNPDQLFALQEQAALAAGADKHSPKSDASNVAVVEPRAIDWKKGFQNQGKAHLSPVAGARQGMKRHIKRSAHDSLIHHHVRRQQQGAHALDSSVSQDDSDLEARATQYTLNTYDDKQTTKTSSAASAKQTKASSSSSSDQGSDIGGAWTGVSSYYLYAMEDGDRLEVLDAVKNAGFKVIRIFVAFVGHGNKGSNSIEVPDLEPNEVGSYDDTVLYKIDQLMYECKQRGLKLLIALSDRYALGYWSTDRYALQLNIVKSGTSGVQKIANAASFYTNPWAIKMFDQRLDHIMKHKNDKLDGRTWAQLDDVVYAYEPQNEPQGHMPMASESWSCDRAKHLKSLLSGSSIKISSGGGITTTDSLGAWAMQCDSFDIVSVHDYGTSAWTTANALADAKSKTSKEVIMGEWGIAGPNKAQTIGEFVSAFKSKGIPQMYWQITKPGKCSIDFEVWTNEPAWTALTGQPATGDGCKYVTPEPVKPTTSAQWAQTSQSWTLPSSKKDDGNGDDKKTDEWKPSPSPSPTAWTDDKKDDGKNDWTPTSTAKTSQETWKKDDGNGNKGDDNKSNDNKNDNNTNQNDWNQQKQQQNNDDKKNW